VTWFFQFIEAKGPERHIHRIVTHKMREKFTKTQICIQNIQSRRL